MKKRFALLLVAVFGLTTALSGCNLFVTDKNAYYSQSVAVISAKDSSTNENITITKEELIQAYNNYYSTLSNYGYSGQELVDKVVETLIDQKVVLNETEKLIANGTIVLSNNDKNDIWQNTYDGMKGLLEDYEDEVIEAWDINVPEYDEEEEDDTTKYELYQHQAEIVYVDGEYKIKIIDNEYEPEEELIYNETDGVVKTVISKLNNYIQSSDVATEAQKRYISDLRESQEGRNLPTDNTSIWQNEVERVYQNVKDNKYLNLYNDYLEKGSATGDDVYSNLTVNDVFEYLEQNMKADYEKYYNNLTAFDSAILGGRSSVNYVMQDESLGEYFYVSHILVKFDDDLFTALDTALEEKTITPEEYNETRNNLIANLCVKEYGETVDGYTVTEMYNDFKNAMNNTSDKMQVFNDYMYKYNEDTGNKGQDYDYVISTKNSTMVESFTEAARELYDNGNGTVGAISGMIESEYGIHILIYLGKVENAFTITDYDTFSLTTATGDDLADQVNKITTTKLSLLNEKTIFDSVYESLKYDNYSVLEALNVETLKTQYNTPVIYYGNYTDLY